ncbi:FitA-like ribbon-helix-helix domain-containing protein [Elstera cyanobacteriorum]|uniref:FitA-like ribbon-helix-helix domain-containing protein n=1 Tax=Elstera cyanobacteriorum TaxID=2022747 RepID=UPI0023553964|nr:plasmid stabilization protein [Elstera cyanobacteriorum]MCK6441160.1 plasmid stabilization protein [Elstera cyanobacteriorum]
MTQLLIPNLDDALFQRLQAQAATHGRTVAEEAEALLETMLPAPLSPPLKLGSAIHALFQPFGGVDLPLPKREAVREPPRFHDAGT